MDLRPIQILKIKSISRSSSSNSNNCCTSASLTAHNEDSKLNSLDSCIAIMPWNAVNNICEFGKLFVMFQICSAPAQICVFRQVTVVAQMFCASVCNQTAKLCCCSKKSTTSRIPGMTLTNEILTSFTQYSFLYGW